jgi:outer membrane protein TolC
MGWELSPQEDSARNRLGARWAAAWLVLGLAWGSCLGCQLRDANRFAACAADDCFTAVATQIEYPEVSPCTPASDGWASVAPLTVSNSDEITYWDLSLEEAVQIGMAQSKVIRDLGGALLRSPDNLASYWDAAVTETDPRLGVDAALSAFDAEFSASVFGEKNDKAVNNEFFGGGTRILQQDAAVVQAQLSKQAATGTQFIFRHNVDYDSNNAPSNRFRSVWNTNFETELRHPLLQGSGVEFNRIAGPNQVPGVYNGVLLARLNTDIELADFEAAVRDLVSNIENAYWDLYFAYRDLDAKIAARDASLETWRSIHALYKAERRGGEAEKEAQAREQFYRFQEEVQNALSGRLIDGTRTGNGSSGGTFRGSGGVQVAERRFRMLLGLPPSDGRLIRPANEPVTAPVHFDWSQITQESLVRRVELRRQRWQTRRQELQWIASKNHLLPRLDAIGRYRWRGFGDDLLDADPDPRPRFDNAYRDLTSGDFQEWQLGLELTVPLGYRRAFAGVRNAELALARSRAILREQEHAVLHEVAGAVAELDRAFQVAQTTANRLQAAREQLAAVRAAYEADKAPLDLLLEAQRRLADAESRHYRDLSEYAVALKNVHYAKGTLLAYDGILLSEDGWCPVAYDDAAERERRRGKPRPLNYASAQAPRVSSGAYDQQPTAIPLVEPAAPIRMPADLLPGETPPRGPEPSSMDPLPSAPAPGEPFPVPRSDDGVAPASTATPGAVLTTAPRVPSEPIEGPLEVSQLRPVLLPSVAAPNETKPHNPFRSGQPR